MTMISISMHIEGRPNQPWPRSLAFLGKTSSELSLHQYKHGNLFSIDTPIKLLFSKKDDTWYWNFRNSWTRLGNTQPQIISSSADCSRLDVGTAQALQPLWRQTPT